MSHECTCNQCDTPEEQMELVDLLNEKDLTKPKKYDFDKMVKAMTLFIEATGAPLSTDENLQESPTRMAKMWEVLLGGYDIDTKQYVKLFPATSDNMVTMSGIKFFSFCAHHGLPFIGVMHISYIPNKQIVGLSKLARIGRAHSKKFQVQEDLTREIAMDLEKLLDPKGVAVQLRSTHLCGSLRGVRTHGAIMTTTHLTGLYKTEPMARNEFLETIKGDPNVFNY